MEEPQGVARLNRRFSDQDQTQFSVLGSLAERIRDGDEIAAGELYGLVHRGLRSIIAKQLGRAGAEDLLQDVILGTLRAIREDRIKESSYIVGYMQGIVRNLVRAYIKRLRIARALAVSLEEPGVEATSSICLQASYEQQERIDFARVVLKGLPSREREILERFYVLEQTQEHIREAMGLTETQFRLAKSRAKARFGELGHKALRTFALTRRTQRRLERPL